MDLKSLEMVVSLVAAIAALIVYGKLFWRSLDRESPAPKVSGPGGRVLTVLLVVAVVALVVLAVLDNLRV